MTKRPAAGESYRTTLQRDGGWYTAEQRERRRDYNREALSRGRGRGIGGFMLRSACQLLYGIPCVSRACLPALTQRREEESLPSAARRPRARRRGYRHP